jgi:hypothetical protein
MSAPHFKTPANEYAERILRTAKQAIEMHDVSWNLMTMSRVQTVCTYACALSKHLANKIKY